MKSIGTEPMQHFSGPSKEFAFLTDLSAGALQAGAMVPATALCFPSPGLGI